MSTKKLLNESRIRRFMKLAAIGPLTENFFDTVHEELEDEEFGGEEETPELEPGGEEAPDLEPEPGDELEPEGEEEIAPEDGAAEAQVDLSEEDAETLMAALGDALADVTGLDVEVVKNAGEEEAPELEPEDVGDLEGDLDDAEISVDDDMSIENVVNEVTMRVAKRLLAESKKS